MRCRGREKGRKVVQASDGREVDRSAVVADEQAGPAGRPGAGEVVVPAVADVKAGLGRLADPGLGRPEYSCIGFLDTKVGGNDDGIDQAGQSCLFEHAAQAAVPVGEDPDPVAAVPQ